MARILKKIHEMEIAYDFFVKNWKFFRGMHTTLAGAVPPHSFFVIN
jgi:hypothetical protein